MMYRVYCYDGQDSYFFKAEDEATAKMLYRTAINSGMYTYVSLGRSPLKYVDEEEWGSDAE